ncbi:MAG: hypothetical protein JJE39_03895, partial [Vicinamibacteria bacterium]|nr:hypothetical protein [Vicinamibacteria bacterium]
ARGWYNGADFYDLFGPTKTSRKGYALGGGYKKNLFFDDPRKLDGSFDVDYFGNLERLPSFQNVVGPKSILSIEGSLAYKNLRGSMGKVDDEKGVSAEARVGMDRSAGKSYPKVLGIVDGGLPLPLGHSSVFLRSAAGYAGGERSSPLASFYFGGFGNNWVDHRDEKRYRTWFAFAGLELNEIPGRSFVKSTLEWNLPPVRFSRAGRPGFYLAWARPAVFAGVLGTDFEKGSTRRIVRNLGGQIDFQLTVLSALDLTLSAGYARAFEDGRPSRHETMVSLKILH